VLPPTILTEAMGQVGAILILTKPENRERLIFFMGMERVRYKRPVRPGDVVVIEATVRRLRSRMGLLRGIARVNGKVAVVGTMTFALGWPISEPERRQLEVEFALLDSVRPLAVIPQAPRFAQPRHQRSSRTPRRRGGLPGVLLLQAGRER
jgi:hypothetical protein